MLLVCKAKVSIKCQGVKSVSPFKSSATKEITCVACEQAMLAEPKLRKQEDTIANVLERKVHGRTQRTR